jgi:hypothetical protein
MTRKLLQLQIICVLLTACSGVSRAGGFGPSAWIDTPGDGSILLIGDEISVQSHSSGPIPIEKIELYVNGQLAQSAENPNTGDELVAVSQSWIAESIGVHFLEIRAIDVNGAIGRSLPVRITVAGELLPSATLENTLETTETPTATVDSTATETGPTGFVNQNANCRIGADASFETHEILLQGQTVPLDGRNADSSWLWIRLPSGSHCWAFGVNLDVNVDVTTLALISSPVLPEGAQISETPDGSGGGESQQPPAAPEGLSITQHVCEGTTYSVTLGWMDAANNESGYRIYRNGTLINTIGDNSSVYTDHPPQGGPYTYKVEAFNGVGSAASSVNDPGCLL